MTKSQGDHYATNRDLWLCLARAFAPPAGGPFYDSFTNDLPEDLAAIGEEIGLNIGVELDGFMAEVRRLPDAVEIQRLYAALFVTPPAPVFMNTGIYLDGAFLGPSELDLNAWYSRHGYERHPGFHDLNDHTAVQFEFVALLYDKAAKAAFSNEDMDALAYATEAERFLNAYPKRWSTPFLQSLETACLARSLCSVYVHLAKIAWLAIEHALNRGTARVELDAAADFPAGSSRGVGALTAEDLAEIAVHLEAASLDYSHIRALPEWREEAFAIRKARM